MKSLVLFVMVLLTVMAVASADCDVKDIKDCATKNSGCDILKCFTNINCTKIPDNFKHLDKICGSGMINQSSLTLFLFICIIQLVNQFQNYF